MAYWAYILGHRDELCQCLRRRLHLRSRNRPLVKFY